MGMNNEDTIENNNNIDRSNLKLITELDREIEENKLTLVGINYSIHYSIMIIIMILIILI